MKKLSATLTLRTALSLILSTVLIAGLLAGCGNGTSNTNQPTSAPQSAAAQPEKTNETAGESTEDAFEAQVAAWKPDQNTITIRVPVAAGGTGDLVQRLIAKSLQETTGTTAVVQNITGSNGFLMATDLMGYDPSPCELMLGTEALFVVAPLFNEGMNISLDDFEILYGSPSNAPSTLAVPASLGINTWEEFVEYAKTNRIVCASNVPGGMTHVQATALMGSAGIEFDSVTDTGGKKNVLACLNGDANCVVVNTGVLRDYVADGQLVPLVQFSKSTFDDETWGLDPIPSVVEIGYPEIAIEPCTVVCCRKGADPVGVEAMRRLIVGYLQSEQGKKELAESGLTQTQITGEEAYNRLKAEVDVIRNIRDTFYK